MYRQPLAPDIERMPGPGEWRVVLQAGDDGNDLDQLAAVCDCGEGGAAWGRVDAVWEGDD